MARSATLDSSGRAISASQIRDQVIRYGPWLGSMRSRPADRVPREYATNGLDFLFMPRYGYFRRRLGQTQKFDTFGSSTGMLPAKWSSRGRWMDEFVSASISDGTPTVCALATKENVASGVIDDGRFSNFWLRDQVNSLNYTVGDEYGTTTYPSPGSIASYRFVPLWYNSGEGGLTRGTSEFNRRFFFPGSRRFLKVDDWTYHPSVLGTPSRWRNEFTPSSMVGGATLQASSDVSLQEWIRRPVDTGAGTSWTYIQTSDGASNYLAADVNNGARLVSFGLNGAVDDTQTYTVHFSARRNGVTPHANGTLLFEISNAANTKKASISMLQTDLTASYADYSLTFSAFSANTLAAGNVLRMSEGDGTGGNLALTIEVSFVSITNLGGGVAANANRLIPSGPIPPTHAGLLVKGNAVAGSSGVTFVRPDADSSDGAWTDAAGLTSLFDQINEVTTNDSTYIKDAGAPGTLAEVSLQDPGFVPTSATHSVQLVVRASNDSVATPTSLTVTLKETATTRASTSITLGALIGNTTARTFTYTLTAAEVNSITATSDLRLQFLAVSGTSGARCYQAYLAITAIGEALVGGWRGKDRFMQSIAYRFKDDSVWMPCTPRFPNTRLPNGFNLFTVDSLSPDQAYDKIQWTNLPWPPFDVKSIILLRTPKIDSTSDDNLQLNPTDLRVVAELKAGTTSYDDYFSEDDSLGVDTSQLLIRYDHIMPPRARYIAGGDMRVIHSYGGTNPCAIELAPVGAAADYDRNLADTDANAYAVKGTYFRIVISSAGAGSIEFKRGSDTAVALLFVDHPTIQDLVDKINATTFVDLSGQWRAQLCPGVSPSAGCLASLTPHSRALTSCTTTISTAVVTRASGLDDIAVGMRVSGTGIPNDTYVTTITSDLSITLSANATASGTVTLTFYFDLGDTPDTGFERQGWQRVIANSLPGFIYFNKTYLGTDTFDKSATWMTMASPGSMKSAPNSFSGKRSNRFTPPLDAGPSQGGAAVDQGFRLFYANKRGVIRNTTQSEQGTGVDEDYRLIMVSHSSGCCAWNTVVGDGKFAIGLAPEGLIAGDLDREVLLSEDIWQHGASEGTSGSARGDFSYEIPKCIAATSADVDFSTVDSTITAYAMARIIRGAIYLNYRSSGAQPNRQNVYDFSSGTDTNGIAALMRTSSQPWGWSVPLARAFTAMTEGRRTDGAHLYGWNDANAGSTGDGRVDEFETGDTDNGTAISTATVDLPWEKRGANKISVQRIILEHLSPVGSTGSLVFHRSLSLDNYTLTPSTSSTDYVRDVKDLTMPARAETAACYVTYGQASGSARELRYVEIWLKELKVYR